MSKGYVAPSCRQSRSWRLVSSFHSSREPAASCSPGGTVGSRWKRAGAGRYSAKSEVYRLIKGHERAQVTLGPLKRRTRRVAFLFCSTMLRAPASARKFEDLAGIHERTAPTGQGCRYMRTPRSTSVQKTDPGSLLGGKQAPSSSGTLAPFQDLCRSKT